MKGIESHLLGHPTCSSEAKSGLFPPLLSGIVLLPWICVCSFSSRHCCFPNPVLWYVANQLRGCWITLLWCCLTAFQFEALIESILSPLPPTNKTKKNPTNGRNGQAPVVLNRPNLELLEHLIFYKPWIWKCVEVWGHLRWKDSWELLECSPWEALGASQLEVAWGKSRCSKTWSLRLRVLKNLLVFMFYFLTGSITRSCHTFWA